MQAIQALEDIVHEPTELILSKLKVLVPEYQPPLPPTAFLSDVSLPEPTETALGIHLSS